MTVHSLRRTAYADRAQVEAFAQKLKDSHLACRELGHNWRPYTAAFSETERAYIRVLRCTRCRTERHQTISASGEMLASQYKYPEGYAAPGIGRIVQEGRDALRLESILRSVGRIREAG